MRCGNDFLTQHSIEIELKAMYAKSEYASHLPRVSYLNSHFHKNIQSSNFLTLSTRLVDCNSHCNVKDISMA